MIEHELTPLDKVEKGKLYDIVIDQSALYVGLTLPYQGLDNKGWHVFGDGPNAIFVHPTEKDLIEIYYDHVPY